MTACPGLYYPNATGLEHGVHRKVARCRMMSRGTLPALPGPEQPNHWAIPTDNNRLEGNLTVQLRDLPDVVGPASSAFRSFQVREMAPDEPVQARHVEPTLNHVNRVVAGVETRDHLLGAHRGGLLS
jgi:hypothetical protein